MFMKRQILLNSAVSLLLYFISRFYYIFTGILIKTCTIYLPPTFKSFAKVFKELSFLKTMDSQKLHKVCLVFSGTCPYKP